MLLVTGVKGWQWRVGKYGRKDTKKYSEALLASWPPGLLASWLLASSAANDLRGEVIWRENFGPST